MAVDFSEIQDLLHQRADYQARLNLLPYDGTPEIKEQGDKKFLVEYYEGADIEVLNHFMKEQCWSHF